MLFLASDDSEIRDGHRAAVEISLKALVAERDQRIALLDRLDALDGRVELGRGAVDHDGHALAAQAMANAEATERLLGEFNKREIESLLKRLENLTSAFDFLNTLDGLALFVNQNFGRVVFLENGRLEEHRRIALILRY